MATSEPVVVSWKNEGLLFEGVTEHGHVDMASGLDEPGNGATPMELLAVALAGCTSMDVVSILQKMRQPLEALRVEVHASDETVELFIEADYETEPEERRRFAIINVPRHLFSEAVGRNARRAHSKNR